MLTRCCSAIGAETTGCQRLATRLSRHDGPTALQYLTGSNKTDTSHMCLKLIISKEVKQSQKNFFLYYFNKNVMFTF